MTITYVVQAGDWLAKIAREHGTTVLAIWNHPENAGHRDRRASPDILYPGDVLRIDSLVLPTSPTDGASPAGIPGEPAPSTPSPNLIPWPYPAFKGVWTTGPTWECPGGTCACHPGKETAPGEPHTIVLYDPRGLRMPGARCRAFEQGRLITAEGLTADAAGEVRVTVRASTSTLRVEWAPPELPGQPFMPYRKLYNLRMDDGDTGLDRRLANLGFSRGKRRQDNVADYQRAYSREPTGDPEEIRLEVLQRHDQGAVEPFHPQGDAPDLDQVPGGRSSFFIRANAPLEDPQSGGSKSALRFAPHRPGLLLAPGFASPTPRPSAAATLAQDEESAPSGGASQVRQGAVVPEVSDLILGVRPPAGIDIDLARIKVWLRPVAVRDIAPQERDKDILPTASPTTVGPELIYAFIGLPLGTYDALVVMEVAAKGKPRKVASGWQRVVVRTGLLTLASLAAEVDRPVHSIDDPLLDADIPGMQRRRKLLATLYTYFPMCHYPREPEWKPPYDQGEYKRMLMGSPGENTCTPVMQSMLQIGLGSTLPSPKPPPKGGATSEGDAAALKELMAKDYFVTFTEGLAPSVGDVVYYANRDDEFVHTGIVVDASPEADVNWISADGGQPSHATEFMKGSKGWGRYWYPPEFTVRHAESAWFLPRRIFRNANGKTIAAHGWANPVWSPANMQRYGGYKIVGWVDLAHPSLAFKSTDYTKLYTEASYRACKELIRKVRNGALADQIACRAIATYEDR
jgi:hypothetical protein